jgi:YD repeat-containing protein
MEPARRKETIMADQPFGAPIGNLNESSSNELKNELTNIQSQSVESMLQSSRIQPRQVGTGVMRGTQRIVNTDGSYITLGAIPDTEDEFGIAYFDANGTLIRKSTESAEFQYDDQGNLVATSTGTTDFKYDASTGKNYYQNGKLPDGSYGAIFMKPNYDVEDAFN